MPVTCTQAAAELGVSPSQVRRWVQAGAPVVRERRPMLIDLPELQRWRQHQHADAMDVIALAMLRSVRSELMNGKTAPQLLGVEDRRAAALLLAAYSRMHSDMLGHDCDAQVNDAIAQLRRIAGMSL